MKYDITGRHLEVTPALRTHVEAQIEKIKGAFEGKPAAAHVVIEVERGRNRSEVIINWHSEVIKAESLDADMYKSIADSFDKAEKMARKLKSKIVDKSHKATKVSALPTEDEAAV